MQNDPSSFHHWMKCSLLASCLLVVAACQRAERAEPAHTTAEVDWARAALQRNPQLELVATDENARVFTIRDKSSGEVRVIKLEELAAAPVTQLTAAPATRSLPTTPSAPTASATAPATQTQPADESRSQPSSEAEQTAAAPTQPDSDTQPDAATNYTIERSDGQVRVTGPGVSIVSSGAGGDEGVQRSAQNAAEPIICEGQRMVHLDNREIYVEGDAITVRGGCEMYITNSRIIASGTGVVVQDGVIHVSNSHIEGRQGSFDADSKAKVFVRSSTFKGLPRRSELALVQDQGGNRWR